MTFRDWCALVAVGMTIAAIHAWAPVVAGVLAGL